MPPAAHATGASRHRSDHRRARERVEGSASAAHAPIWSDRTSASPSRPASQVEYTLRGYIVSAMEKKGGKQGLLHLGRHRRPGKRVHRVTGEETASTGKSKDPWAAVSATVVQAISTKTATRSRPGCRRRVGIACGRQQRRDAAVGPRADRRAPRTRRLRPTPRRRPAATAGSIGKPGSIMARVPSVTGAPGDGSIDLAQRHPARADPQRRRARRHALAADLHGRGQGRDGQRQGRQAADPASTGTSTIPTARSSAPSRRRTRSRRARSTAPGARRPMPQRPPPPRASSSCCRSAEDQLN